VQAIVSATGLFDDAGQYTGSFAVITDITELKRAEEALRTSQEKFAKLSMASPHWMALATLAEGRFIEVNQAFVDVTGFQREEAVGKTSIELGLWTDPQARQEAVRILKEEGRLTDYHLKHRMKNGEIRDFLVSADVVNINGEPCIINLSHDITDRKRMEEDKARLETQLRQAQKMEAIGTLAGGIAHDFNNILTAIIGYTELAMADLPAESPFRANLDQVFKAGQRARDLVRQILNFSRKSEEEKQPLSLAPIVKEALKLLRASLPTTIEIKSEISSESGVILGDPTQIHQLIMNLCTNAADAMRDKGGLLEVKLERIDLDQASAARYAELEPGVYHRLTVQDTGQGIEPELIERIFDPFFTTKEVGQGTGMGLAVAHGIVKDHGGMITVYSEPGRGSAFHVYLPILEAEEAKLPPAELGPLPKGRERILLVDDEAALVEYGRQVLGRLGYEVTAFEDSQTALKTFQARPDEFDLVVTDQTMPHLTGAELAAQMLLIRPGLPIILCTGYSDQVSEEKVEKMGIRRLMVKPLLVQQLAEAVRETLDESR
ncbi:MAG: response regulator, partial [Deltaproteobacteria bacterium]|nr:response regulator [Deltaproteobacteria bacterium]